MFERMTIADYKEIYEKILHLSFDADGFGLFKHITDEDVEKCIWIAAILDVLNDVPLGRMGLPEEIAAAVVYFASDDAAYTTGQILTVSGGFGLATPLYGDLSHKTQRR